MENPLIGFLIRTDKGRKANAAKNHRRQKVFLYEEQTRIQNTETEIAMVRITFLKK